VKTAGGVTTQYLVDDRNLTGYAQVLEELSGGTVQRIYTYGLSRISQGQTSGTSFYGWDAQGSVRLLTDTTGAITDRYDYDAFGNIINQTGTTPNSFLYVGEQFDQTLGLIYLRARYFAASRGRFLTQDTARPDPQNPLSINRFLYAFDQPTDLVDPSGLWPTETHNFIVESAFEGFLPAQDITTLEQVSANQDSIWMGGQDWSRSYEHHMRDGSVVRKKTWRATCISSLLILTSRQRGRLRPVEITNQL
jgi:RHS repeat-associated protein